MPSGVFSMAFGICNQNVENYIKMKMAPSTYNNITNMPIKVHYIPLHYINT